MEIELNEAKLRVYECGKIEQFKKKMWSSKEKTWFEMKGGINIHKNGYKHHTTKINKKNYITSRIIYFAFNPNWDINNSSQNNTIDHINRNSLDNRIINLRVANKSEQNLNKDCVINQKGYCYNRGKWQVQIRINGKKIYLGRFETEEKASQIYLNASNPVLNIITN